MHTKVGVPVLFNFWDLLSTCYRATWQLLLRYLAHKFELLPQVQIWLLFLHARINIASQAINEVQPPFLGLIGRGRNRYQFLHEQEKFFWVFDLVNYQLIVNFQAIHSSID